MKWSVRIIALKTIREYWNEPAHADSEKPLRHWYEIARGAEWASPRDVKTQWGNASVIGDNRIVFNIAGNKYRLVVKFNYRSKKGFIRFIGTHAQYDSINAESI